MLKIVNNVRIFFLKKASLFLESCSLGKKFIPLLSCTVGKDFFVFHF
jgi:hypothetical protein